ncbi:hypothetical protein ACOJCM_08260 [Billgrantia sp. LNSP4103-1]|uniref:hypothetical protein n=1 Tax=Billgrantia sp. LNSP4103-1 TaxID=3410266 RepID=UPI00403F4CF7
MNMLHEPVELLGEIEEVATNAALCKRLVMAKTKLDRLERDGTCKDLSALSAARVEFALASRALADALIAQELAEEVDLS